MLLHAARRNAFMILLCASCSCLGQRQGLDLVTFIASWGISWNFHLDQQEDLLYLCLRSKDLAFSSFTSPFSKFLLSVHVCSVRHLRDIRLLLLLDLGSNAHHAGRSDPSEFARTRLRFDLHVLRFVGIRHFHCADHAKLFQALGAEENFQRGQKGTTNWRHITTIYRNDGIVCLTCILYVSFIFILANIICY